MWYVMRVVVCMYVCMYVCKRLISTCYSQNDQFPVSCIDVSYVGRYCVIYSVCVCVCVCVCMCLCVLVYIKDFASTVHGINNIKRNLSCLFFWSLFFL